MAFASPRGIVEQRDEQPDAHAIAHERLRVFGGGAGDVGTPVGQRRGRGLPAVGVRDRRQAPRRRVLSAWRHCRSSSGHSAVSTIAASKARSTDCRCFVPMARAETPWSGRGPPPDAPRRRRERAGRLHLVFAPARTEPEQHGHDDAEEHPAVEQMIDARGDAVVREVAEHHDHVGADPVRDDRHQQRHADEDPAAARRAIEQVREQAADHERRDEVAQAAAGLDDRPAPGRDHEERAFAVHRDAARADRQHRDVGGPVDQHRNEELADRHREEQEARAGTRARRTTAVPSTAHTPSGIIATIANCATLLMRSCAASSHSEPGRSERRRAPSGDRLRRQRRQRRAIAPHEVQEQRDDEEAVREGLRAVPDRHHRRGRPRVDGKHPRRARPRRSRRRTARCATATPARRRRSAADARSSVRSMGVMASSRASSAPAAGATARRGSAAEQRARTAPGSPPTNSRRARARRAAAPIAAPALRRHQRERALREFARIRGHFELDARLAASIAFAAAADTTTGRAIAIASSTLFWMPRATRSGATTTRACWR